MTTPPTLRSIARAWGASFTTGLTIIHLERRAAMSAVRYLLASAMFATASTVSYSQEILPSDVGVTLIATPTTDLLPGQPIDMTLSVTNYGPNPLPVVIATSSVYIDEMNLVSVTSGACIL